MTDTFEFLETQTTYLTEGLAVCQHKDAVPVGEGTTYRVAWCGAAADKKSEVQRMACTFMRMHDNCSLTSQAVESMSTYATTCVQSANFTNVMVESAWRVLAQSARYAKFCVQNYDLWQECRDC